MTDEFQILDQVKQETDLDALLAEIHETRFIAELTRQDIETMIREQAIRFFYEGDQCAGFGAWIAINDQWSEVGPFYVAADFQGHGLGKRLLQTVTEANLNAGKKAIGITINPAMKHVFEKTGYQQVPITGLPLAVNLYMLRKLKPQRLLTMFKNVNADDKVAYYVKR